ncbi:helix-turn-helix transcriptional regulator [Streptomyces sp. AK04-3B]|uniref:helix-turn-helix transcriptional regulator n=1 Tax=unclassified Streptomyces TaxID=2593676 RepID=UPI0029BBCFD8|nr:helix-turn-helix transcriptional regulator [Streptomyces sp. AK04-3B]MDX3798733.1 helix-turn-helix transcriptional regulator [Streptomyces sp. AK04-3B]
MCVVTPVNPPPLDRTSPPRPPDAGPRPVAALPEGVRVRALRLVHGDPRAAAELAARLTERQAAGLDPLPTDPAEQAPDVLRAHRREVRALPDDTRLLLLLAAADQYPVATHAFLRAVAAARLDTRPLEAAETAGLAYATAGGVGFRDAWTRIAAYETAAPDDRRDVHRLLARVLHDDAELPRRSWHRGAAALGPSGRLAAELATAADRARAAADPALAAALAERAAVLCPAPRERSRLLAHAAADAWNAGDADRSRTLAARTDADALTGVLALRTGHAAEAFDALLTGAAAGADPAPLLARATEAAVYTGDLRRCREAVAAARQLGVAPPGVLGGIAAAVDGRYEDARDLLEATAGRCGPGGDPTDLLHAGVAALMLGDHPRAATATVRAAAAARTRGLTSLVPQALEFRAYADFWTGRPRAAEAAALDALRQAHATGQDNGACHLQAALAMFAALTGDGDLCRRRAAEARAHALAHGLGLPAALAQWALAFLDLGTGRYGPAAARLRALAAFGPGHGHRAVRHSATPHYVEAAVRTGDTRVARAAHADYDRWARAVRSADELALSARCRALLTPGADALDHYRTALELHAEGARPFEHARTELLFGSALRRLRHRAEARDRLHSAREAFESFGAPHCAEAARAELRALGAPATPARGADSPAVLLTAQQFLIARMAAEGATNREIAVRLALSHRTIDHHLRGVFNRLGIRSRIELVRLIAEADAQGTGTSSGPPQDRGVPDDVHPWGP